MAWLCLLGIICFFKLISLKLVLCFREISQEISSGFCVAGHQTFKGSYPTSESRVFQTQHPLGFHSPLYDVVPRSVCPHPLLQAPASLLLALIKCSGSQTGQLSLGWSPSAARVGLIPLCSIFQLYVVILTLLAVTSVVPLTYGALVE